MPDNMPMKDQVTIAMSEGTRGKLQRLKETTHLHSLEAVILWLMGEYSLDSPDVMTVRAILETPQKNKQ